MKKINITFQELAAEFNHNAQILYKLSQEPIPDDMAEIVSMATSLTSDCQAMIELCLVAESRLANRHPEAPESSSSPLAAAPGPGPDKTDPSK